MITAHSVLLVILLLQIKHLVIDWLWQTPYELLNKGIYGHEGGQQHAAKHAVFSAVIFLAWVHPVYCFAVFLIDFVIHYHIDWLKVQLTRRTGWTASDTGFWWLTGADQFLHQITYLALVCFFCL